jgi:hypothetical protein
MRNSLRKFFLILTVVVCLASANAMAQMKVGIRAGYTDDDPGQIHVGAHFVSMPFLRDVVTFRPNVEVGFGKHAQTYTGNFEIAVKYITYGAGVSGYVGAGPSINVHKSNSSTSLVERGTRAGMNFMIGIDTSAGLFTETKVGIKDGVNLKMTVGYSFPIRQ